MPATRRPRATTSKQPNGTNASNARKHPAPSSRRRDYVDRSKLPPPPREEVRIWAMCHGPDMFSYLMEQHYKRAEREEIRKMHEAKRKENEAKRQARLEDQKGTKAAPAVDAESSTVATSDAPTSSSSLIPSSGQRRGRRAGRGRRRQQQQGETMPSSAASTPGPSNTTRGAQHDGQHTGTGASAPRQIVDRRPPAGLTPAERHQFAKQFMDPRSLAARRTSWPNEGVASGNSFCGSSWSVA